MADDEKQSGTPPVIAASPRTARTIGRAPHGSLPQSDGPNVFSWLYGGFCIGLGILETLRGLDQGPGALAVGAPPLVVGGWLYATGPQLRRLCGLLTMMAGLLVAKWAGNAPAAAADGSWQALEHPAIGIGALLALVLLGQWLVLPRTEGRRLHVADAIVLAAMVLVCVALAIQSA